jgi:ketosteroid isomerase-like protein
MANADAKTVVDGFFNTWTTGDFAAARGLLHDDLSFSGPIATFDNADGYVADLLRLVPIVTGAKEHKVFVDGDDVCIIYDLMTNTPIDAAPVGEWYRVRDGKIAAVRVFLDARPFAPVFEQRAGSKVGS